MSSIYFKFYKLSKVFSSALNEIFLIPDEEHKDAPYLPPVVALAGNMLVKHFQQLMRIEKLLCGFVGKSLPHNGSILFLPQPRAYRHRESKLLFLDRKSVV